VFSHVADSAARMKRVFAENLRYYTYLAAFLTAGVIVLAPVFILAIYGETWRPAILPMQLLAPVGLLLGYSAVAANGLYAVGKPRTVFVVSWLEAGLMVLLLPPATYLGNLPGTSLAANAGAIVAAIGMCLPASRAIGLSLGDWRKAGQPSILAASFAAIVTWVSTNAQPTSLVSLAVSLTLYVGVYIAFLQLYTRGRFLTEIRGVLGLAFGQTEAVGFQERSKR